jgi:predicted xylose isomerase-like sugar epimerase
MATDTSARYLGFAPLNDQQLSELRALEEDLGVAILALKHIVPLADLTPEQVSC